MDDSLPLLVEDTYMQINTLIEKTTLLGMGISTLLPPVSSQHWVIHYHCGEQL